MGNRGLAAWIDQVEINKILLAFNVPRTPKQVEKDLRINKLKIKPFLDKNLLESLNPKARKGRLYVLTNYARRLLKLYNLKTENHKNWDLIGWIIASPKQRLVVLKTLAVDSTKRTSEEIRERASKLNPHLSRISTKGILRELVNKRLVETEMIERKRYYWISGNGKAVVGDMPSF